MINTIIFDFGDVFINLNKKETENEFRKLGLKSLNPEILKANDLFEKGELSEIAFLEHFQKFIPNASIEEIRDAWNTIIGDFPLYRLEFLQNLVSKYRLFLLSNTDAIHINHFNSKCGQSFSEEFYKCFEKIHFSYEMGMRKPDTNIYKQLIEEHKLSPSHTLFVDDKKENTDAAKSLGMQVWNLQVGQEDVIDLFEKNIV